MDHLHLMPKSIHRLCISGCGITAKGIEKLCSFVKSRENVTVLLLHDNPIGDEGVKHMADMLRTNASLEQIIFGDREVGGSIGPKGIEYLFKALAVNKSIQHLSFFGAQHESDEMVQAFCQGLAKNRFLKRFRLNAIPRTRLSPVQREYFKECLRSNLDLIYFYPIKEIRKDDPPEMNQCEASFLLTLNNLNRKIIRDPDATLLDWLECVMDASEYERIDFSYYFLRNKPELCMAHSL